MAVVIGHDAIHANVSRLPRGQTAGYTTGSADIKWTAADWALHPEGVRICQDSGSDHGADVLDVERGAASNADACHWYKAAAASYAAAGRRGQRHPAIYTSASNVTPLVNTLIGAGIKSGPGLWVANWNLTDAQAVADVQNAAGPYPIVGVQFASGQFYDTDVFSTTWLAAVATPAPAGPFRHVTAPAKVADLAAAGNVKPSTWLARQAADLTDADAGQVTWAGPYYTVHQ